MECFKVNANEIEGRLDPFYYKPEFIKLQEKISSSKFKFKEISQIAKVICGPFGSAITVKDYKTEGVPLIRISNIEEDHLSKEDIKLISKEKSLKLKPYIVKKDDLIISQRGTLGLAVKIDESFNGAVISANLIAIKDLQEIPPDLMQILLSTKIGQIQLLRKTSGQIQKKVTTDDIKTITVPVLPQENQIEIVNKIKKAYSSKKSKESEAQQLLDSIDDYVLDELGIKIPELKDKMCFVVDFDEVKNKRVDPYYYQPKFEEVEKVVKDGKFGVKEIGEILRINLKLEDIKKYEEVNYIDLASINKNLGIITNVNKLFSKEVPSRARQKLEKGELLLSGLRGSLKSIAVFEKDGNNFIGSTGFYVIKESKDYNNYYLWALFRSQLYQMLLNRKTTGAIMSAISRESLLKLKIPLPPLEIQNKIAGEVKVRMQKAKQLQEEAKSILEEAKEKVERIILCKEEI